MNERLVVSATRLRVRETTTALMAECIMHSVPLHRLVSRVSNVETEYRSCHPSDSQQSAAVIAALAAIQMALLVTVVALLLYDELSEP